MKITFYHVVMVSLDRCVLERLDRLLELLAPVDTAALSAATAKGKHATDRLDKAVTDND